LNSLAAASFASEGQQRTIALALKIAQARHIEASQKSPPVLLLDDIFGELDTARRNRLLKALPQSAQTLITTTFLDWVRDDMAIEVFSLAGKSLTPLRSK
jgi:DNA replication and repair protein RecF